MFDIVLSPADYNLPHPEWREHQFPTTQWIENHFGVMITEAPTGSGKSAYAVAQASSPKNKRRTAVLTRTKSLQLQYGNPVSEEGYGAHLLMGKANYPCEHPEAHDGDMCDECIFANTSMHKCPLYRVKCGYGIAKEHALSTLTPLVCTNYAYWLTSSRFREAKFGLVVLDECQLVSNITIERAGTVINDHTRLKWRLPVFPFIQSAQGIYDAVSWLEESRQILRNQYKGYQMDAEDGDEKSKKLARACERLGYKFNATLDAIGACSEAWWVRAGPRVGWYHNHPQPGIVIKPLTARYHFPRLFLANSLSALLMSATVGSFDAFAEELGIRDYHSRRVPPRFPPSSQPIHLLDVPKMSYKSGLKAYEQQADEIAKFILDYDPTWSGIIHVTRKKEAPLLAGRLARRGLQDRMWVTPQQDSHGKWLGTQDQVRLWNAHRDSHPGAIVVAWQFHEGYDGREEKLNITAKVQFPFLGDPYEKARMRFSGRMYLLRTAWSLMQSQGRNRRGRDCDYDTPDEKRGANAIADGNWNRVKSYLSEDFLERLVVGR